MRGLSRLRSVFRGRKARYGSNTAVVVLTMTAILALAGVITTRHPKRYDLTENQRYSLSEESRKVLAGLASEVRATAFFQKAHPGRVQVQDLLEQYAYGSRKFSYDVVDPDANPALAKSFEITSYGTIVLQSGQNTEKITQATEEAITNALLRVTRTTKKTVYFLTGHGEPDMNDPEQRGYASARKAIEEKGYQVKTIFLMQEKDVPEDASILVVAGPRTALMEAETESIRRYISRGGKVFMLLDPMEAPGMEEFLAPYGIILGQDMIIDRMSRIFGADARVPVITTYQQHPITSQFKIASFFPLARSVDVDSQLPPGVSAQRLALTGPGAWAETDIDSALKGQAAQDANERKGPIPVAVVATVDATEKQQNRETPAAEAGSPAGRRARIVVFGDSDFVNNTHLSLSGNRDLFLNTISWLAEEENLISIRAKSPTGRPLLLTAAQGKVLFWLPVVVLPLVVIGAGITVLLRRRFKG